MAPKPLDAQAIRRHAVDVRIAHWIVAIAFILLGVSGLGFYYSPFYVLTGILGGGEAARILHPWVGVVLAIGYLYLFIRFVGSCLWRSEDNAWIARHGDVMAGRDESLPEIGKFNAGQKLYLWAMALLILVLLASGVLIWNVYFGTATSLHAQRIALLAHSIAAVLAILGFIVHVHVGTWEAGTLRGMVRGTVTGGWAWKHHRKWLRQVVEKSRGKPGVSAPAE